MQSGFMPMSSGNGAPTDFARFQVLNMTQFVKLQVVGRATEKVKTSASSQVSSDAWSGRRKLCQPNTIAEGVITELRNVHAIRCQSACWAFGMRTRVFSSSKHRLSSQSV